MVMFGSGMVIHNSLTELTQDAGLASLRRRLGKAAKASASVTQTMGVVEPVQENVAVRAGAVHITPRYQRA